MQIRITHISLFLLLITAVVLIPFEQGLVGWILLAITALSLTYCETSFRRDMMLVVGSLGLLGITSITTDISYLHIFQMGMTLLLAVALPFFVTRYIYKKKLSATLFIMAENGIQAKFCISSLLQ